MKPVAYPHGSPYHCCIRLRAGVVIRNRIPNFVVVSHECSNKKPRLRYLQPLPDAEPTLEKLVKQNHKRRRNPA